jgi:hypothetical protein
MFREKDVAAIFMPDASECPKILLQQSLKIEIWESVNNLIVRKKSPHMCDLLLILGGGSWYGNILQLNSAVNNKLKFSLLDKEKHKVYSSLFSIFKFFNKTSYFCKEIKAYSLFSKMNINHMTYNWSTSW